MKNTKKKLLKRISNLEKRLDAMDKSLESKIGFKVTQDPEWRGDEIICERMDGVIDYRGHGTSSPAIGERKP